MDWLSKLKRVDEGIPWEGMNTIKRGPVEFHGAAEIVTKEGESLWIATELEDAQLIPEGKVYFLGEEIERLHKAGKEAARTAYEVKKAFGNGVKVTSVDEVQR